MLVKELFEESSILEPTIESIADLAVEQIEKWLNVESDEYFGSDKKEQVEYIESNVDEFFDKYINDDFFSLEELEKLGGYSDHQDFISKNRTRILNAIVKELK